MIRWRIPKHLVIFAAVAFVLIPATVLFSPAAWWYIRGIANGEPFYHHRPTSYWATTIRSMTLVVGRDCRRDPDGELRAVYIMQNETLTSLARLVGLPPIERELDDRDVPFATKDASAIPVLIGLTYDNEWKVRWFALLRLNQLGHEARVAEGAVRRLTGDEHQMVRYAAESVLESIGCQGTGRPDADLEAWFKQ